jgi:hypothetical protein
MDKIMNEKPTKGVLMEHMVFQKTRTQNLADVRSLNMWGYELDDVGIVSKMYNIETLALPINNISTLAPFAACKNLKSLLLRQNQISEFEEVRWLQALPSLSTLSLCDNPIAKSPNYRETVIRMLPQLHTLDEVNVSVKKQARATPDENSVKVFPLDPPVERARAHPSNGLKRMVRNSHDFGSKKAFSSQIFLEPSMKVSKPAQSHIAPPRVDDSNMLAAVLSLIPELTTNSLQIVLEAIQERCA